MSKFPLYFLLLLLACSSHDLWAQKKKILLPPAINEASGLLVLSEDSLLWINDSGDGPYLYLTDVEGNLLDRWQLPQGGNKDWEELSQDDKGNIYIGDFGNNCRCRKDLRIYIFNHQLGQLDSIQFFYPSQLTATDTLGAAFDLEAFFWLNDSLHLITKGNLRNKDYSYVHLKLPARPGIHVGERVGEGKLKKRVVTAASVSNDGKEVILLAYYFGRIIPRSNAEVFIFRDFPSDQFWQVKAIRRKLKPRFIPTQFEAIDYYDKNRLMVGSEKTPLFRGQARIVRIKKKRSRK